MAVVTVIRKGHPCGEVRVEESEMLNIDTLVSEKKPAPKKKAVRKPK
jgi:hypothetical protein